MNKWTRNQKIAILIGILTIIGVLIAGSIYLNSNVVKDSNFNQSPVCVGENCKQTTNYIQEEKELYLSPNKKLIKPNMADYVFPFKIVNEKNQDFNDVALVILVPESFGMYRIMVEPIDKTEKIVKYNGSMELMLPGYGFPKDGYYWCIYNIESIYARETKEYSIKVNTRDYPEEFFMIFKWTSLSDNSQLKEMFKGFGVE